MTPQENLRRALLNDEFPEGAEQDRLYTPSGEDALRTNRNIALSAWMTQVSGQDINAGSPTWQHDKDALVQGFFKNPTASNVSDEQLHSLVKTHIQTSEEAADMAANMALQGKTSFEALKEMNVKRESSLVSGIWDNYTKDLVQRHSVLSQKLAPYRGIVDSAALKLSKEMEWSLPITQAFQDVATQLIQVPEQDRHLVISAIGATGGATAEERASYLSKLAGAMGRMTETLGASSVGTMEQIWTTFEQLAQVPESIASALSGGVTMQGELASSKERSDAMLKAKENQQAFDILTQQIRQVADSEVSPIKGDNWWSQIGIDLARTAPQVAVTVANPMLGTAANLSYFRNTVAAEAKSEDPSLTYQQADTIGALTAPFNAAVETFTTLIPFGKVKLPILQKWLSSATTSVRGAARNFVIRGAATVGAEVAEEMAQAIAPLWTQDILGALKTDMPGVDWEKRMPDFSKIAAQTWGPALVFSIVGGGGASISDIKSGRALASDRDKMVATGMAPAMADQIATAAESGDWSKADSLFRQEFVSTTKATDEEKTAAVARIIETQKAQDGFRSNSERGADELERAQTIEKAMESLTRTRVFRDAEGWAVEDTDTNDVVRVSSREEAANLAYSRLDDNAREEAQAMAKVLEAYSSGADILELDLGKTMDLSETGNSEAAMKEAAITEGMLNGMTREQAEKITWTVLGSNQLETAEGVRRVVSKLFHGAGVMDAVEEPIEGKFQAGLEQGVFTSDEAMSFVKIAAEAMKAPELVAAAESSPRGLIEAISDIVMADTFGQRKDGAKGVAGSVTAGLKARLRRQADMSGAESKFAAFLAAFRRFFKQVFQRSRALLKARKEGELSGDFDEFLDTLMRVDPQRRHEVAAAKEAMEIAQAGNMPFSLAPQFLSEPYRVYEKKPGATYASPVDKVRESLAELTSAPLIHETNLSGARKLLAQMMGRMGRIRLFTTNDPALALGQGGAGIKITFNPARLNGHEPNSLQNRNMQAVGSSSREFIVEKFIKGAVQKVEGSKFAIAKLKKEIPLLGEFQESDDGMTLDRAPKEQDAEYDDAGNIIPPSQRFNEATSDIRFSLAPRSLPEVADTILAAQMKKPVFFEAFVTLARRRMAKLREDGEWVDKRGIASRRIGFDTTMAGIRSAANIEAERKFRLRSRQRELIDAGMAQLTPETIMAYDQGVTALADQPLIASMLNDHGKLMSKTTAQREGKLKTDVGGNSGDYDGVPRLPIAWYSKGAGLMPDVMAQNLADTGLIGDASVDTLWEALRRAIHSTRSGNEAFQKAREAVRKVETDALAQARTETDTWAKDETAKIPTEKDRQMMALRTLDAILSAFPPVIRDKVGGYAKLASYGSDKAREAEIIRRLEMLDKVIESEAKKHYSGKISEMLDKAAPVGKPGEVKKSKFIVTVQDEIDAISEMVGMDSDDVADSISNSEAAIISAQTPEAADAALAELKLLEIFGGVLDIKRTSSQELEVASEYLEELLKQGREARKIIDESRRERVKEMVNTAKSEAFKGDAGPETTQAAKSAAAKKSGQAILKKFFIELSGFDAVLRDAFGANSKTAREFSERFTLNSNNYEDAQNERRKRFRDFARELYGTKLGAKINQKLITLERIENNSGVTYLKGREVKAHKLTLDDAAKIVADPKALGFTAKDAAEIQEEMDALVASKGRRNTFTYEQVTNEGDRVEIPLSQMDALYISMALRQPGILEQQQRYGYDQETVDQLGKFLTDETKTWREWMQGEYDAEYVRANEVYMRMFNARMPKLMFYAPLLKNHQGQQAILDPLNTGISSNSANPGSIKSRKARTSSLRIDSALSVFWSHFNQMEYWVCNAEYLRDVQSVMLHPDVRQAVVSAHGEDGMAAVSAWVQLQMSRGVGKAALATAASKMFRNVKSAVTMKALALNLSTALKTIPSAFYSLGEIHMSKWPAALVSGMKHWDRLWETNIIQRRLDIGGMPELRDLGSSALPMSWVNQGVRYGSYPTMYSDGVFTTYSAAMAYGTAFDEAKRQDAGDDVAHKYAEERTALIVSKTAQPENWTQRSLFENDNSGAGLLFFIFTSDPRQKLALTGEALNQWRKGSATTEEAMRKLLAYWIIPGIMFQLANAIGRSLFKGDDDEWEVVDFATAALVGQLQGLALIGSAAEMIFSAAIAAAAEKITGEEVKRKPFWNSPKNPLDGAANDLIKSVEKITEDDAKDGLGKAWEITKSAGMLLAPLSPAGAIPSTTERVMKDTSNLFFDADKR